jgi:hypothetical protein
MRTIDRTIFAALRDLVPNARVYPIVLPQDCVYPAMRYTTNYAIPDNSLCGNSGLVRSSVQIDIFSREHSVMLALREEVVRAMISLPLENLLTFEQDDYEADLRLFRKLLQYSVAEQEGRT